MLEEVIQEGREITFIKNTHHVQSALYAAAYLILTTPLRRWSYAQFTEVEAETQRVTFR